MKSYSSILIIYNPNALKGKIDEVIPHIKQRLLLRYSQVDAMFSPETDGAEALAFKYASKYDVIVSCGGDGTLHEIVNGVMFGVNFNTITKLCVFLVCLYGFGSMFGYMQQFIMAKGRPVGLPSL